uniref:Protein yippee-like n=1 Tax=Anopheles epiroticus TaxID=199890 RepID=A0A182PFM6_9DIPT
MGKIFLEHMNGPELFNCGHCDTNITTKGELISTRFVGESGAAFLFKRAVNLIYSEPFNRKLITGWHVVRDVRCKYCLLKLGWMYEFAVPHAQQYAKRGAEIVCRSPAAH